MYSVVKNISFKIKQNLCKYFYYRTTLTNRSGYATAPQEKKQNSCARPLQTPRKAEQKQSPPASMKPRPPLLTGDSSSLHIRVSVCVLSLLGLTSHERRGGSAGETLTSLAHGRRSEGGRPPRSGSDEGPTDPEGLRALWGEGRSNRCGGRIRERRARRVK